MHDRTDRQWRRKKGVGVLNTFCANKTHCIYMHKMAQLAIDMDARINLISSLYKVNDDGVLWKGTQSTDLNSGQR
jgi:hypothetical protein